MGYLLSALVGRIEPRDEEGAIGALILGIIIGAALIIFGIIKLLIPG